MIDTRFLYTLIYLVYLVNAPEKLLVDLPGLHQVDNAVIELEACENAVLTITESSDFAMEGKIVCNILY